MGQTSFHQNKNCVKIKDLCQTKNMQNYKQKNIPFKLLLQKSLVKSHGLQCGFCTPGMVMTMYTLFHNIPQPTADQMERALEGNIVQLRGGVFRISICHSV